MSSLITLNKVTKVFPAAPHLPALRDISFSIDSAEQVALLGQSGSGKSTLLSILGLLDSATAGEYYFEGKNVFSQTPLEQAEIRKQDFAFIFQQYALLNHYTALQNVMLPFTYRTISKSVAFEKSKAALAAVGLSEKADFYPAMLSGGQKQRIAIARALVTIPRVIFADEPTAALDEKNREMILALLKELSQANQAALIVVTHDENVAHHFKRKLYLSKGTLAS